jgi:toxin ParE1/3/4
MKEYRLSPLAEADLIEIWDYIALDNPDAADKVIRELMKVFSRITHQPEMGVARDDVHPNFRQFPYRRYVIFYILVTTGIEIFRVLHSARDIESQFEM